MIFCPNGYSRVAWRSQHQVTVDLHVLQARLFELPEQVQVEHAVIYPQYRGPNSAAPDAVQFEGQFVYPMIARQGIAAGSPLAQSDRLV